MQFMHLFTVESLTNLTNISLCIKVTEAMIPIITNPRICTTDKAGKVPKILKPMGQFLHIIMI